MTAIRHFFRRYPAAAMALLAAALAFKALVPAGYMLSSSAGGHTLTFTICSPSDAAPQTVEVEVAVGQSSSGEADHHMAGDSPCAFTALGHAATSGADGFVLAIMLAFTLALGFAVISAAPTPKRDYLRPPLRGPPLAA